jgi:general secretion pathway protein M
MVFTTPLVSRLSAVLLLVTAILAAYTLLVEPMVIGYTETGKQIEEMRDQLARFERAAASRPALTKQMKDFEAQQQSRGYLLSGTTDALAAASLQDEVHDLIIASGGTLDSVEPMPGVEEHGLMRITLRVQMTGTSDALFEVLYALEAGNPILFVENLNVRSHGAVGGESEVGSESADLAMNFELSGYLPKGAR